MTRHAQLWCSLSIVAVLLLSGCQVALGGVKTAVEPPAAAESPVTAEDLELRTNWILEYTEFARLYEESTLAHVALGDRVRASGKAWGEFLDEFEDLWEAFRVGAYDFVIGGNNLPRFPEVRDINDRISAHVEAKLQEKTLYVQYLEESRIHPRKIELFDEYNALRLKSNKEWLAIVVMANDLAAKWSS